MRPPARYLHSGGSALNALTRSSNPSVKSLAITVLVRRQDQADVFASHGIDAVLFKDIDDSADLRRIAANYDIVIHNANSFHAPSAVALIEGLGDRKTATGQDAYFIQSTGTSNVGDHPFPSAMSTRSLGFSPTGMKFTTIW